MKRLNLVRLLERISPDVTARIAFDYISNPRIKKFRAFEKPILEKTKRSNLRFKQFDIAVYQWGEGKKTALLVHGWEGRSSNFGAIIPELIKCGYKVIGFDAPGHGNSSKSRTNFFDISELIEIFLKRENYDLIMTHSIGSVMTLMAMSKLKYSGDQLIVFTTPNKFEDYIEHTINHFGLTVKTKAAFLKLIRAETIYEPLDLQAVLFVQDITLGKVVFIHDKNDKVIDIEDSRRVSILMPNAEFIEIQNTGHFKMLWSEITISLIKKYL
ncbi:MAG: alpha/beta hydrolase [Chitinophagales bacterium]|nr:alpha/beta hydrolase [Chitinophagales bacterium]